MTKPIGRPPIDSMPTETFQALWEQYQYEQANDTGFFAPNKWLKGQRNFAAFCAEKRIADDFDKAMKLIGAVV